MFDKFKTRNQKFGSYYRRALNNILDHFSVDSDGLLNIDLDVEYLKKCLRNQIARSLTNNFNEIEEMTIEDITIEQQLQDPFGRLDLLSKLLNENARFAPHFEQTLVNIRNIYVAMFDLSVVTDTEYQNLLPQWLRQRILELKTIDMESIEELATENFQTNIKQYFGTTQPNNWQRQI